MKGLLKKLHNQKGFTFIEAILTAVLLAVGLTGGYAMMQNSIDHSLDNDHLVIGSQLANEKLQMIIADKTFVGYSSITQNNYQQETLSGSYRGFTRSTSVTEVSSSDLSTPQAGSGYKKVEVTVRWGNDTGQQVKVSTMLANHT
ncbi:prepilin-type N-terminal cleavage/methylation domain-containing protein [bacterium]|nr:prepilin-type N-terminal cleavage/methylation domain-containing protein [bacterium]